MIHPARRRPSEPRRAEPAEAVEVTVLGEQRAHPRLAAQGRDLRVEGEVAGGIGFADRLVEQGPEAVAGKEDDEARRRQDTADGLGGLGGRVRLPSAVPARAFRRRGAAATIRRSVAQIGGSCFHALCALAPGLGQETAGHVVVAGEVGLHREGLVATVRAAGDRRTPQLAPATTTLAETAIDVVTRSWLRVTT
jgi:hypothetical protein